MEAIRQKAQEDPDNVMFIHLTLLPYIPSAGELKTKPTQHSVKELRSIGIQPHLLLCRCDRPIPSEERRKIALFCNVRSTAVIEARDVRTIYEVPLTYYEQGFDREVLRHFKLPTDNIPDLSGWRRLVDRIMRPAEGEVRIAIVGKYTGLLDAYKSLQEALTHGGIQNNVRVDLQWIDAEQLEIKGQSLDYLFSGVDAILVPGGFGERGSEGKILAVKYAREKNIPYFGICFGMQMAVIETARHVAHLDGASSTEFADCAIPLIGMMTQWHNETQGVQTREADSNMGGTMRLGAYPAILQKDSMVADIYGSLEITERHRHRYEVNMQYRDALEKAGLLITGTSPDGLLPEIVERHDHPWFIAVQFHPELKSRPFEPHPLFVSFVKAALDKRRGVI
jgi:CTP synthase